MSDIVIKFTEKKKINRINLFVYPLATETNVEADSGAQAADYKISYATDSALTVWVDWAGLEDRSEEIGQAPTTISDGLTSGNTNTYNSFHDTNGVDAYGVKVIAIGEGTVKFTEIEVWRTLALDTFDRINIDEEKDLVNNKFLASLGAGTYVAKAEDFYPGRGEFVDVKAKDVNKMKARVYGGYSQKGVEYWTIIRHFALYDWTIFLKSKKIEFRMKDRVKELKEKEVFLAAEVLEGKTREWLIEWMGLKSNLHSAEMSLFQSNDTVNYFYPVNQTVWDEMTLVAQGLDDIDLFIDRFGKLKWNVYLENIPHFWTVDDYLEFQECTLNNLILTTEGDKAVVEPGGASGQVQVFSDSGLYEISLNELSGITQDTWFLKATDEITIDAGKDTAIFNYNVQGVVSDDGLAQWQGRIKIEIWLGSSLIDSWTSDGDTSNPTAYREHSKNIGISPGTYMVKRYLLGKYVQISTYENGQTIWHTYQLGCATNELIINESLRTFEGGSIESNVQDLLITPDNWGALTMNFTGSQSTVSTNTSADGTNWEGWKEVIDGEIKSKLDRFMKWKVEIPATDLWVEFPKLYSVEVSYFSGSGTQRWSKIAYEFSDDDLDELPMSFNDEREGQRQQYDKVEVAIEPFILVAVTDIWQGQVDWQTVKNKNYTFNPEFDNPVKIDGDYKLYINSVEFLEGETTHDNLTVSFTKHPVKPIIMIKQSGDTQVTITGFKLTGKQYIRGNRTIASAGTGLKVLRIENNYINSSSFAQQIASNKYTEMKDVIGSMDRDTGIDWLPVLNFLDIIQIKNTTLGTTKMYRIYKISHEYNVLSKEAMVSTKIRCKEIDRSIFYDPLYWDDVRNEERIYWGADVNGNPRYRGGRIFG